MAPCYLTGSDAYYPGWRATVAGQPAPLLRANHAFRAVPVPAGISEVVLRFVPTSLRMGLFLSLLAAACTAGMLAATARQGARRT